MKIPFRIIKFRAWDDTDGSMGNKGEMLYNIKDIDIPLKLMQYTGLKDKNDTEIYEGDIIRWYNKKNRLNVVLWDEYEAKFSFGGWAENNFPDAEDREVIGNIYSDPHLLNK